MAGTIMSDSCASTSDGLLVEDSIPEPGASLESILCTEELQRRPSRPPDFERENRALVALVTALADSPTSIFETLAETIRDITQCDSAGLSLLTRDGKGLTLTARDSIGQLSPALWNPHVGGGTPRNFGPCGDVLDQNRSLLFQHFEAALPLFAASDSGSRRMPAGSVLRCRQSSRNNLGDHAQRSPQVRRRRRSGHGLAGEIRFLSVSSSSAHRRPNIPGRRARKGGGRNP